MAKNGVLLQKRICSKKTDNCHQMSTKGLVIILSKYAQDGNGNLQKINNSRPNIYPIINNIYFYKKVFVDVDWIKIYKVNLKKPYKARLLKREKIKLLFYKVGNLNKKKTFFKIIDTIKCILFMMSTIILQECSSVQLMLMANLSAMMIFVWIYRDSI